MIHPSPERSDRSSDAFDQVPEDESQVIRRHSRSFRLAATLLPRRVRNDVETLYAWCRWCDEAVDAAPTREHAELRLATLRDDVSRIFAGEAPRHRASAWMGMLVARYPIPSQLPRDLISAMESDLDITQVESEEELLKYCYHAAGVVGLMLCHIFGVSNRRAARHAASLGIAMQLTNIARDVREDQMRGRCYLPATWLPSAVNSAPRQGAAALVDSDVRPAIRRILLLAEEHYQVGFAGLHFLPADTRTAVRVAAAVYREIGLEIGRHDYRVMGGRIVIPKRRLIYVMLTAWIGERARSLKPRTARRDRWGRESHRMKRRFRFLILWSRP